VGIGRAPQQCDGAERRYRRGRADGDSARVRSRGGGFTTAGERRASSIGLACAARSSRSDSAVSGSRSRSPAAGGSPWACSRGDDRPPGRTRRERACARQAEQHRDDALERASGAERARDEADAPGREAEARATTAEREVTRAAKDAERSDTLAQEADQRATSAEQRRPGRPLSAPTESRSAPARSARRSSVSSATSAPQDRPPSNAAKRRQRG
jgi:hypothetical protein